MSDAVALLFCPYYAKADPPHPRLHEKWVAMPNQTVILTFRRNGSIERWVYKMVHEAEPARDCSHQYDKDSFTLITYDETHPYRYKMEYKPIMRWDRFTKEFVVIE